MNDNEEAMSAAFESLPTEGLTEPEGVVTSEEGSTVEQTILASIEVEKSPYMEEFNHTRRQNEDVRESVSTQEPPQQPMDVNKLSRSSSRQEDGTPNTTPTSSQRHIERQNTQKESEQPKPNPPARPARPRPPPSSRHTEATFCEEQEEASSVVTFDVGGTIFRCKTKLLEKYPNKRLHRLLLCGCERTKSLQTIFVDRNPAYFSLVMDWYRMGAFHLPDSLSLSGLQHEAMYFDVFQEMFPKSVEVQLGPSAPIVPQTVPVHQPPPSSVVCFTKSFVHTIIPSQAPLVFILRAHEQLILETATGVGRILLRVSDFHGTVTVPQAVLYDSHSYFFLGGGQAKLHGTPFPGNLIYTFWTEHMDHTIDHVDQQPIQVEFKIRYVFSAKEQIQLTPDEQQTIVRTVESVVRSSPGAVVTTSAVNSLSTIAKAIPAPLKPSERKIPSHISHGNHIAPSTPLIAPVPIIEDPMKMPYMSSKEHVISLPEKTKERAQILDEAQHFQAKVKEHAAWLQHYQREIQQTGAISNDVISIPPTANSPTKKYSITSNINATSGVPASSYARVTKLKK